MPDKCCVPGCSSNYASDKTNNYIQVFRFPKDPELKKQWIKNIPRDEWQPSKWSVVCIKHFNETMVSKTERYKDAAGNWKEISRSKVILNPGAVPCLFPNLPNYLSKPETTVQRQNPEVRRQKRFEAEDSKQNQWLADDIIQNFEALNAGLNTKKNVFEGWFLHCDINFVVFYKCNFDNIPKVISSVKVFSDMTCQVCVNQYILTSPELQWILPTNLKLSRWSQLENILNRYKNKHDDNSTTELLPLISSIKIKLSDLQDIIVQNDIYDANTEKQLSFLIEQFSLIFSKSKKYSVNMIVWSFMVFTQSSSCYSAIRETGSIILPHKKYLQLLSSSFNISPESTSQNSHFLNMSIKSLLPRERFVILQVDEIYVSARLDYKGGRLIGSAENKAGCQAKTVVAFLISSAFGNFKEVVSLHPVVNINGNDLYNITQRVIDLLKNCGFHVISIISDNNRVNRNLFQHLLPSNDEFCVTYPNSSVPMFVTYDFVHILKNIRNNWLNLKDSEKTFVFPPFLNLDSSPLKAKIQDLRNLYKHKCDDLIKTAYKLNYKSLYPSNLERQKVSLVCNVFHETTYCALKTEFEANSGIVSSAGTHEFIKIILDWWSIVNTKSKFKKDHLSGPFCSITDGRLQFLNQFLLWLDKWKTLGVGCLTKDTLSALYQSTFVLIKFINYSLTTLKIEYVLPGKLQTDNLEHRFSCYRQLSGGNYHISVTQIFESEKKMRLKSILGLKSAKYGQVSFSKHVLLENDFVDTGETINIDDFMSIFDNDILQTEIDESSFLYISGYVAFKAVSKMSCLLCISILKSENTETDDKYFQELNRGGLTHPSGTVLEVGRHIFGVMTILISSQFEEHFLAHNKQKELLISLTKFSLLNSNHLKLIMYDTCLCTAEYITLFNLILSTYANILINNYTKLKNDIIISEKNHSSKKRKLQTLMN